MPVPDIIKQAARNLRKNQTEAEKNFWNKLRRKVGKLKVYRQKPILVMYEDNKIERYVIADFYFPFWKLIVEVDGSVHENIEVLKLDREKEKLLRNAWYSIIRFSNEEILSDSEKAIEKIVASFSS